MNLSKDYYTLASNFLEQVQASDTYKEWTKGANVKKLIANPLMGTVLVLIQEDETTFTLYRFFGAGTGSVHISCDMQNTDAASVIDYLMEALTDNTSNLIVDL